MFQGKPKIAIGRMQPVRVTFTSTAECDSITHCDNLIHSVWNRWFPRRRWGSDGYDGTGEDSLPVITGRTADGESNQYEIQTQRNYLFEDFESARRSLGGFIRTMRHQYE